MGIHERNFLELSLIGETTIPQVRKVIAESSFLRKIEDVREFHPAIVNLFSPSAVLIHEVSGGFNSVVEVSASHCRKVVASQLATLSLGVYLPEEIIDSIRSNPMGSIIQVEQITGTTNYQWDDPPQETTTQEREVRVRLVSELIGLRFEDPHKVCLRFKASLILDIRNDPYLSPPWLQLFHRYLPVEFEICCNYISIPQAPQKRVNIYADFSTAQAGAYIFQSDTDRDFFETYLLSGLDNLINQYVSHGLIQLTPTISLTGESPSNQPVPELEDFHVLVFHVDRINKQAIAAAFDLLPGCQGAVEDVEHFIGDFDYGVISDEFVVERVFKFKWRIGGFDRSLGLTRNITVTKNGSVEDATLYGRLDLQSLNFVTITTDSSTRRDYIRVGGTARSVPTHVQLNDGTILDSSDVDFGSPENTPWSIATDLEIDPPLASNLEIREFQQRAHTDAYRHTCRPFSHFLHAVIPEYSRVEGVTKQIFILGNFTSNFL